MSEENTDPDRIAELETKVEDLSERLEVHQEVLSILTAREQSDVFPDMGCPNCGEGTLVAGSGLTWEEVSCTSCDFSEYL